LSKYTILPKIKKDVSNYKTSFKSYLFQRCLSELNANTTAIASAVFAINEQYCIQELDKWTNFSVPSQANKNITNPIHAIANLFLPDETAPPLDLICSHVESASYIMSGANIIMDTNG